MEPRKRRAFAGKGFREVIIYEKRRKSMKRNMKSLLILFAVCLGLLLPGTGTRAEEPKETVVITFDANGGSFLENWPDEASLTREVAFWIYGEEDVRFDNTRLRAEYEGMELCGWSTDQNAVEAEYEKTSLLDTDTYSELPPLDGSVKTLYAVWGRKWEITFHANGGNFGYSEDRYGNRRESVDFTTVFWLEGENKHWYAIPEGKKEGEVLLGWSTDPNAAKPEYVDFGVVELNEETPSDVYAIWGKPEEQKPEEQKPEEQKPEEQKPEETLENRGIPFAKTEEGLSFFEDTDGNITCYDGSGRMIRDAFVCDGTYTYYIQYDGTAMKDRLTYHPDGVHVIYFDSKGYEVFSDFANVKQSISGDAVDDYCFFDVNGYMYVDVITWDKTGSKLYYANPYGVLERNVWFQFSKTVVWGDGTEAEGIAGGYGCAGPDGTLLQNQEAIDWLGRSCYLQGNGVALYE